MDKNKFFLRLQQDLELNKEVNGEMNFKDLDEWDSLATMVLIAIINEEFSITLNSEDIENITTVNSLINRIGVDKFN